MKKQETVTYADFERAGLPRPMAFGGGKLAPECDLSQVTPEAAERDFVRTKTLYLWKWFKDCNGDLIRFEIRRDKDGVWFGWSDKHEIHCHGDTMRELWQLIHSATKSFSSRNAA